MAIAPEHPGLEVTICIDGQPLPEYEDDEEDPAPKTTTKYIEARSDRHFSIVTRFKPPFPTEYHVRAWLSIDGIGMDRRLWLREDLFERPFEKAGIRRQEGEEWVKQKFSFAKLNIGKYSEYRLLSYADWFPQLKRLVNLFLMSLL